MDNLALHQLLRESIHKYYHLPYSPNPEVTSLRGTGTVFKNTDTNLRFFLWLVYLRPQALCPGGNDIGPLTTRGLRTVSFH